MVRRLSCCSWRWTTPPLHFSHWLLTLRFHTATQKYTKPFICTLTSTHDGWYTTLLARYKKVLLFFFLNWKNKILVDAILLSRKSACPAHMRQGLQCRSTTQRVCREWEEPLRSVYSRNRLFSFSAGWRLHGRMQTTEGAWFATDRNPSKQAAYLSHSTTSKPLRKQRRHISHSLPRLGLTSAGRLSGNKREAKHKLHQLQNVPKVGYVTISLAIMPPGDGPIPCCPSKPIPPMGNFWLDAPKGISDKTAEQVSTVGKKWK